MSVVLITHDLACSSRVRGAAQQHGREFRTIAQAANLPLESITAHTLVLVDLTLPKLDPKQLVADLRSRAQPPRAIVAFGPHVHEQLLAAATAAGCDAVLARGQFYAQLDALLSSDA